MDNNTSGSEGLEKLREMVKDIDFAMLTTIEEDGTLHSRPMSTNGEIEGDGDLWFFTSVDTEKVQAIEHDQRVNVAFASPEKQRYISMSGTAQLVRDKAKIKELWKPHLKAWFPDGPEEADIGLIKVSVEKAEYWDAPSSKVAYAIGLAKSIATGERADNVGENKEVNLKS